MSHEACLSLQRCSCTRTNKVAGPMAMISSQWTGSAKKCAIPRVSGRYPGATAGTPTAIRSLPRIFRTQDCAACPTRHLCTRAPHQARFFKLLPRAQQEALQTARAVHVTEAGQKRYARRACIEGTISQSVRAFSSRRIRYRGLAKTHLQQMVTAVAINVGFVAKFHSQKC